MKLVRLFRDPIAEGAGGEPISDLTNQEGFNDDGSIMEGYQLNESGVPVKIPEPNVEPPNPDTTETEGLDANGVLLDGYEQLEDGTIRKIATDSNTDIEITEEDEANQFYEAVALLTGETYEIDYNGTDPISPEGVAIRDKVIKEKGMVEFENHLKSTFPKAYAYFLHLEGGGEDNEFFNNSTPTLPARAEFEANTDLQTKMVLNDLISKDVDPEIAQATVDKYVKENTIGDKALLVYEKYATAQANQLEEINKINTKQKEEFDRTVNTLLTSVDSSIKSDMKLIVPENKQQEFSKFVKSHIRVDNGKFFFAQEINSDLPKLLEQFYFKFNNGNLKSLVERQARSITTQRLRTAVNKDKNVQNNDTNISTNPQGFVPLGEIKFS